MVLLESRRKEISEGNRFVATSKYVSMYVLVGWEMAGTWSFHVS